MSGSFKKIMIAAISGMVAYAGIYETIGFIWAASENSTRIVISLIVAIAIVFIMFGLITKAKGYKDQ